MPSLTSLRGILILHEGVRLKPYDDKTGKTVRPGDELQGKLTIGVGRNLTDRGISTSEMNTLLNADILKAEAAARAYDFYADLGEPRQAVVVSMIFNLGVAGFAKFRRTHKLIRAGKYEQASMEMVTDRHGNTNPWAEQVGDRALHLAQIMRTGQWIE
jgi:lysozyme